MYDKGGSVLRMLHAYLNATARGDTFFAGLMQYLQVSQRRDRAVLLTGNCREGRSMRLDLHSLLPRDLGEGFVIKSTRFMLSTSNAAFLLACDMPCWLLSISQLLLRINGTTSVFDQLPLSAHHTAPPPPLLAGASPFFPTLSSIGGSEPEHMCC